MIDFKEDTTIDQPLEEWLDNFDPRMRSEIHLAVAYIHKFNHGTSGHLAFQVIARLAMVLETYRRGGPKE